MLGPWNQKMSQAERALAFAVDTRKFEIERFWQRSLFFWGFIAAAAVAYSSNAFNEDGRAKLVVACFGTVCSLAWTLSNRGSKYWQEAWEAKVERLEQEALGLRLFSRIEPRQDKGFWGASRFSVTKLAIALSDFTLLIWMAAVARLLEIDPAGKVDAVRAVAVTITALYATWMLAAARTASRGDTRAD